VFWIENFALPWVTLLLRRRSPIISSKKQYLAHATWHTNPTGSFREKQKKMSHNKRITTNNKTGKFQKLKMVLVDVLTINE